MDHRTVLFGRTTNWPAPLDHQLNRIFGAHGDNTRPIEAERDLDTLLASDALQAP
jgi:hypothetical protein